MRQLKRLLDGLSKIIAWLAGLLAIFMMVHVTIDAVGRTFFNAPLTATIEIVSAYYMVGLAFLPLALIALERGYIMVELFTSWMKPRARSLLDGFAAIVSLVYVVVFAWQGTVSALHQTEIGEAREAGMGFLAVWPSRWVIPIGVGLMAVYVLIHMVQDFVTAMRGHDDHQDLPPSSSLGHEEPL